MGYTISFSGGSEDKSICLHYGRPSFNPWVRKMPCRRKWQPTPILLLGKSHGRRNLVGYSPLGRKESDTTERLSQCYRRVNSLPIWPFQCCSVQFSRSVVSNSLWLHELQHARPPCPSPTPEVCQTHVHWVSDAIQPSHPLSSPFPPALNLSQHQGLFKWVSSLHQVAKVLEFQLQDLSFQWTPRTDLL